MYCCTGGLDLAGDLGGEHVGLLAGAGEREVPAEWAWPALRVNRLTCYRCCCHPAARGPSLR